MIAWSRAVMGLGMGLVFIPLMTMAFTTIKKEELGNATGIFNLTRNLAGSFGVAFVTSLLARRAQFHQFRLIEHLNPYDPRYQLGVYKASAILQAKTGVVSQAAANGAIYQQLMRQASLFSFTDAFHFSTMLLLCVLPLVFFLRTPKNTGTIQAMH
jgi:DHA2 family multidrug resistance protein